MFPSLAFNHEWFQIHNLQYNDKDDKNDKEFHITVIGGR